MSSASWTLDEGSEARYLRPWLDAEPDPLVREEVLRFLGRLLDWPFRPDLEERPNVFSARVIGTTIVLIWSLDHDRRMVVLHRCAPA